MTTIEIADARVVRRGPMFWVCRYLPGEIAGTAALVLAGLGVTVWTDAPIAIALAGLVGAVIGFYGVLAVTIYSEHSIAAHGRSRRGTFALLLAEFGPVEFVDTLLIRPAALMLGVWMAPDPTWGLLAGKLAADVLFYAAVAKSHSTGGARGVRAARDRQTVP
ncbi:hypothetical protein [Microbacterium immunditiarum]|uniref:Uncharacterized protein n=1 Tax=Microbacterium immunditiarum TaxID=337480 RepID=A0A7Y9KIU2_9MICO|nr:hypothetical protein [Microbacterium immunditiarum]NYE19120.1 hypothetical protein [Microbacterium immunditiarum]